MGVPVFGVCRAIARAAMLLAAVSSVTPLEAAWPNGHAMTPRADFRPLSRADDKGLVGWRRPQPTVTGRIGGRHERLPDITGNRSGARKAVPVTRGQAAGLRFRPDERDPLAGQPDALPQPPLGLAPPDVDFRPIQPRARLTYEELEAQRRSVSPPSSQPGAFPSPMSPPVPPAPMPWAW